MRVGLRTYILGQLDLILVLGLVLGAQEVSDCEKEEEQFNRAPYRVVLVTAPDVA